VTLAAAADSSTTATSTATTRVTSTATTLLSWIPRRSRRSRSEISQSVGADGVDTVIKFQGFFAFNGNEFTFSAVQPEAGVMEFTTGKTTHELKLKAAVPSAPNPFE